MKKNSDTGLNYLLSIFTPDNYPGLGTFNFSSL